MVIENINKKKEVIDSVNLTIEEVEPKKIKVILESLLDKNKALFPNNKKIYEKHRDLFDSALEEIKKKIKDAEKKVDDALEAQEKEPKKDPEKIEDLKKAKKGFARFFRFKKPENGKKEKSIDNKEESKTGTVVHQGRVYSVEEYENLQDEKRRKLKEKQEKEQTIRDFSYTQKALGERMKDLKELEKEDFLREADLDIEFMQQEIDRHKQEMAQKNDMSQKDREYLALYEQALNDLWMLREERDVKTSEEKKEETPEPQDSKQEKIQKIEQESKDTEMLKIQEEPEIKETPEKPKVQNEQKEESIADIKKQIEANQKTINEKKQELEEKMESLKSTREQLGSVLEQLEALLAEVEVGEKQKDSKQEKIQEPEKSESIEEQSFDDLFKLFSKSYHVFIENDNKEAKDSKYNEWESSLKKMEEFLLNIEDKNEFKDKVGFLVKDGAPRKYSIILNALNGDSVALSDLNEIVNKINNSDNLISENNLYLKAFSLMEGSEELPNETLDGDDFLKEIYYTQNMSIDSLRDWRKMSKAEKIAILDRSVEMVKKPKIEGQGIEDSNIDNGKKEKVENKRNIEIWAENGISKVKSEINTLSTEKAIAFVKERISHIDSVVDNYLKNGNMEDDFVKEDVEFHNFYKEKLMKLLSQLQSKNQETQEMAGTSEEEPEKSETPETPGISENNGDNFELEQELNMPDIHKKYLAYQDVTPGSPLDYAFDENGKLKGADKKYTESLSKILYSERAKSLEIVKSMIRNYYNEIKKKLGIEDTVYGKSDTWIYWDIAKQDFMFQNPDSSKPEYLLADPLDFENSQKSRELIQQIVDRHIGWEISSPYSSFSIESKKTPQRVLDLLRKAERNPGSSKALSSLEYSELGRLVREMNNLPQITIKDKNTKE